MVETELGDSMAVRPGLAQAFTSQWCRLWCPEVPTLVPFCFPRDVTRCISLDSERALWRS